MGRSVFNEKRVWSRQRGQATGMSTRRLYVCMCMLVCVHPITLAFTHSKKKKKIPWRQCTHHQQQCQRCPSMHCHSYIHKDIVITVCTEKHTWTPTHTTTPLFLIPCFGAAMSRVKWRANIPGCHYSQTSDQLITKTWDLKPTVCACVCAYAFYFCKFSHMKYLVC